MRIRSSWILSFRLCTRKVSSECENDIAKHNGDWHLKGFTQERTINAFQLWHHRPIGLGRAKFLKHFTVRGGFENVIFLRCFKIYKIATENYFSTPWHWEIRQKKPHTIVQQHWKTSTPTLQRQKFLPASKEDDVSMKEINSKFEQYPVHKNMPVVD